jgi:hypothetical protein
VWCRRGGGRLEVGGTAHHNTPSTHPPQADIKLPDVASSQAQALQVVQVPQHVLAGVRAGEAQPRAASQERAAGQHSGRTGLGGQRLAQALQGGECRAEFWNAELEVEG